jgi:predicted ATPase
MLTRLEVHGFKNLIHFEVDFGPFNCIAGPNGVGKSNVFDAIRFLSLLADYPIMEAALMVRDEQREKAPRSENVFWEPNDLFWTDGRHRLDEIILGAEMIVDEDVADDFGRPAQASSTFLRYEVAIGYERSRNHGRMGRLALRSETLSYYAQRDASARLRFNHSAGTFRDHVVKNRRRGAAYISTETAEDGLTEILVHQDGGSSGKPKRAPAETAPRTIVGTTNTSTTPTILAARREMQQWRFLALEPTSMRGADRFYSTPKVTPDGAHLPATLHRLAQREDDSERVYARVANRLSSILPVQDVRVDVDDVRQLLTLEVKETSDVFLPARALSDGTLRFMTLCVLEQDPEFRGLLCMEEPENGIHPARMPAMVDLLRDLAVDPFVPPGPDNPLRQVILATHSPLFVQLQNREDLLHAERTRIRNPVDPSGPPSTTLRCLPLQDTPRARNGHGIGRAAIVDYLKTPPNAQIELALPELDEAFE